MNRDLRSSQRSARGLARRRNKPVGILRFFIIFGLLVSGFTGLLPVQSPISVETAEAHHTNIKLPVPAGETWSVSQGYNTNPAAGGSHYSCNPSTLRDEPSGTTSCSQYWQYKYSFDIVPADGSTAAGRTLLSPVNGVIRWIDQAYGGMSINLEDGYAYAYFHTNLAPGLAAGQRVTQGQYLGTVAPGGQAGNGGFPHIHITLWQTSDGGNWDRVPTAFAGSQAIEGVSLAAQQDAAINQHRGVAITSSNIGLANEQNPPASPVHLSPSHGVTYDTTSQVVTLNWAASNGATEYQVWINDSAASGWISATSFTTSALGTGQYAWQVKARGSGGEGPLSGKWVFWVDPSSGSDLPPLSTTPGPLGVTSSPTSGSPGTNVVVTGAGMSANETVNVYWDTVGGTAIGQTVANSGGNWRITFTLPDATGGQHQILARGASSNRNAGSTFSVSSSLQRIPISGVPGTPIQVTVKGFGNGELVTLTFYHTSSSTHALGTVRVNSLGTGTATVTLPASTTGQHDYRGLGQTSGRTAWGALWIQPRMTLSEDQGASGASVTATVRGFPGSSSVRVAWNQSGSSSGTTLCTGTTTSTGTFPCTFTVPAASAGAFPIVATAGSTSVSTNFGIAGAAALTITPESGFVASPFQLSLGGFQANETVRLTIDGTTNLWRTVTVAANGTALVKSTIPYLTHGNHTITARGVTSGRSFTATVSVAPGMEMNQSGGAPGATASAWMRGFGADKAITLRFNSTNGANGSSVCTGRTSNDGSFSCSFQVPSVSGATYPVRAVSDGLSATTNFAVTTAGEIVGGAVLGIGTYQVTATREGLVGHSTSTGHVIVENDHFVALPACTPSNCPWLTGGSTSPTLGYITDCGDKCFVRVTNPATGICRVEPIWDTGPWFTNDNWWEPTERRNLNNLPGTVNILPQGYPGTDAARDGLDVGYGLSNGIGRSNVGYETGNRAAIDIADGTWQDIGFQYAAGIGTVVVSMLWQTGEDVATARDACLSPSSEPPGDPRVTPSSLSGHAGDVITISGTGYGANEGISIYWNSTTSGSPIATTVANGSGAFSATVTIPVAEPGSYYLVGKGNSSARQASRTFTLLPPTRISIDPTSGATGSGTTVTGVGYHRSETVTIYWHSTGSSGLVLSSATANTAGEFSVNITIPNAPAGNDYIVGKGNSSSLQASRTFTVNEGTSSPGTPRVEIDITTAYVGAVIPLIGSGYGPGESVRLYWDSTGSTGTLLKTVTANGSGEFETTFTVPQTTDGKHLIVGLGMQSGAKPSRSLTIQERPEIVGNVSSGAPGAVVDIQGQRFLGSENVELFWNSTTATPLSNAGANPDGSFSIGIAIPSGATAGAHTIIAKGATSGFEATFTFTVAAPAATAISFSPMSGPIGTTVTITGSGFGSGEIVRFRWDNTSSGLDLGSTTADTNGAFTATITVPNTTDGPHRLIAHAQTSDKKPFHDFTVTTAAAITFSPMSGPPGATVTITGSGFENGELVSFRWDNTSSGPNLGSVNANSSGAFTATVTVPDASEGPHRLIAHAQTTGKKPFLDFEVTAPVIEDPRITIDPAQGRTGTLVTINGTGYQPGETVEIRWNSSSSSAPLLATVTANGSGEFTTQVTAPNVVGGAYRIVGKGLGSLRNPTRTFTVTPSVGANAVDVEPGDEVRLTLRGFQAGEPIEIYFDSVATTPLAMVSANSIGVAAVTISIPAAVNGTHSILAVGGATSAPPHLVTISSGSNEPATVSFASQTAAPRDRTTINLANYWSAERVEIYWDDRTSPTSSFVISPSGSFSGEITVPTMPGGAHTITVVGVDSGKAATANITLVPGMELTPPIGAAGARIRVDVRGWTPGQTASVYFNRTTGGSGGTLVCSAVAAESGTAACSFNVPSGFPVGTVVPITAVGTPGSATALFEVRNDPVGFFEPADESTGPDAVDDAPIGDDVDPIDEQEGEAPPVDETPEAEEPTEEVPVEEPAPEPTLVPEVRTVTSYSVSDVSVYAARPDEAGTEPYGVLEAGGPDGAATYISFNVEGIGAGTIVEARLVLTGGGTIGGYEPVYIARGIWIDESSASWSGLPNSGLTSATDAGWTPVYLPPTGSGEAVWIDVTTSVAGDGVITFVITGNEEAFANFLSRESGNGPRLEITVQD